MHKRGLGIWKTFPIMARRRRGRKPGPKRRRRGGRKRRRGHRRAAVAGGIGMQNLHPFGVAGALP